MAEEKSASPIAAAVRRCWGAKVVLAAVEPLAGDASSRRYARLRLAGGGPPTAVAMILGPDRLPLSSEELAVFPEPPAELPFVNVHRYLAAIGVDVPEIYYHDEAGGILLLEDVGDTTLWEAALAAGERRRDELYRRAIGVLAHLQAEGERRPDPGCMAFQQRFDARLLGWELDHFLEYGVEAPRGAPLPARERRALRAALGELAERLAAAPTTLAHRDFHSWNLFVQGERLRVIDFQDALIAPLAYDLASLLTDRGTARLVDPEREARLVEAYRAARAATGAGEMPAARLAELYHLCVLHRALKVLGRFEYLERVRGRRGYRRHLPLVAAQARRALRALPEMGELARLLSPHLPPEP